MKRILTLLLLGVSMGGALFAKQVEVGTAKTVAQNFVVGKTGVQANVALQTLHSFIAEQGGTFNTYYVFSVNDHKGFVVVAADDIVKPILAYSLDNQFESGLKVSPETDYWMGTYRDQIAYLINNGVKASDNVTTQWQLLSVKGSVIVNKPTSVVLPMLTTTWNQGAYYDIYTPGTGSGKTPVGCVATAMAQIMKYWNYPSTGTGTYSYNTNNYGVLSADFGATNYNWSMMPNTLTFTSLTSSKNAVSVLGYQCAIAVEMDFTPTASGSQVLAFYADRSAENAFKNHFGYKNTIEGLRRRSYSDAQWLAILKGEMDKARPVLYAGFGDVGGHAFVFDGYDENDMFHINWGWGGMSDGYFTVDNLAPSALGIGGGGGDFNSRQQALVNIEPAAEVESLKTLELTLAEDLSVSRSTIAQGDGFIVDAFIKNSSELDYLGGYFRADIYKSDSTYFTYYSRLSNQDILSDSIKKVSFSTNGLSNLARGEYFIKISYLGVNAWVVIADKEYNNRVNITVLADNSPTGISNAAVGRAIAVYPNPAGEKVLVNFSGLSGKVSSINLFDIQGKSIFAPVVTGSSLIEIPVSQLAEGIYYIKIVAESGTATKKITVKH